MEAVDVALLHERRDVLLLERLARDGDESSIPAAFTCARSSASSGPLPAMVERNGKAAFAEDAAGADQDVEPLSSPRAARGEDVERLSLRALRRRGEKCEVSSPQ